MKLYDLVKVLDDDKGVVIKGKANDTLFSGRVIDLKKDKYFSMLMKIKNIRIRTSPMLVEGYFEILAESR